MTAPTDGDEAKICESSGTNFTSAGIVESVSRTSMKFNAIEAAATVSNTGRRALRRFCGKGILGYSGCSVTDFHLSLCLNSARRLFRAVRSLSLVG